jgi:hypothetical protein
MIPPSHSGVSSIEDEFGRCIGDVEEEKLEIDCDISLQQQEISDLRGANSRFAVGNRAQRKKLMHCTNSLTSWSPGLGRRGRDRPRQSLAFCKSSGFYGNKTVHHLWGSNPRSMIGKRHYRTALFGS